MSAIDYQFWAKVCAFVDRFRERRKRGIPPTEADRIWFDRHGRSRRGIGRQYRVRPAEAGDHPLFAVAGHSPQGFISIIRRDEYWIAVVKTDEERFGPAVDSDGYAGLRMDALIADERKAQHD